MKTLPDHLGPNLKVIFIGYNPSLTAAELGHYYAGRNNRFWSLISQSGLFERNVSYKDDATLLSLGFGFTDIVKRPTKAASELSKEEFKEGAKRLKQLLMEYRPRIACFVGSGVYEEFTGKKKEQWGFQDNSTIGNIKYFVIPSPSGLNRISSQEILDYLIKLKELLEDESDIL